MSVNSSGRVAREVAGLQGVEAEVVVLCETRAEVPNDGLERFTHHPIERWRVQADGRCERCAELHLVSIDPRTYELRAQVRLKTTGPDLKHAAANRGFWEAADRTDAVALHFEAETAEGSPAGRRHLAVSLDVGRLLEDEAFHAECVNRLRVIASPDLVLLPRHRCTEALERLVAEAYEDLAGERIRSCAIGGAVDALRDCLHELEHVLLVDDTVVSGGTLVRLHQEISESPDVSVGHFSEGALGRGRRG